MNIFMYSIRVHVSTLFYKLIVYDLQEVLCVHMY